MRAPVLALLVPRTRQRFQHDWRTAGMGNILKSVGSRSGEFATSTRARAPARPFVMAMRVCVREQWAVRRHVPEMQ